MSATGRGAVRRAADFYPTPAWAVRRLLEAVALPDGHWLEPSAGDGAIIRAVHDVRPSVVFTACELREECAEPLRLVCNDVRVGDFLATDGSAAAGPYAASKNYEVAILNPPFTHAQQFIEKCKTLATWVCALERLNFLEGEERNAWLRADAPDVHVLPNRPSFTGEGTDSIAYAWFVWTPIRGQRGGYIQVLPVTPAVERRVPKLVLPEGVGEPLQRSLLGPE